MLETDPIGQIHRRLAGVLKLTTNVMTNEGRQIVCRWKHDHPDGTETECLVLGGSLDQVYRKVLLMEEDFRESEKAAAPQVTCPLNYKPHGLDTTHRCIEPATVVQRLVDLDREGA